MHPTLVSSTTLRKQMLGGISSMSLWRWLNDADLCFPRPIYIGRRRFWREADVTTWIEKRAQDQLITEGTRAAELLAPEVTLCDMATPKPAGGRRE